MFNLWLKFILSSENALKKLVDGRWLVLLTFNVAVYYHLNEKQVVMYL